MNAKLRKILMILAVVLVAVGAQSCLDDDDNDYSRIYPNAIVTMKNIDGATWFQLDDSTLLYPVNLKGDVLNKEVRAFVNFRDAGKGEVVNDKARNVWVNWIDTVRTKSMAQAMAVDSATVGNDPVEIVKDWSTVCEDGYLTLRFRTYMSGYTQHKMNLVATSNPYEVRLYHDACGDRSTRVADGVVAFRLDKLPDTQGKTVDLTLKWKSFSGEKSVKFKYRTRK
jgi:hypothetical protein